jgi:hypothetical protein
MSDARCSFLKQYCYHEIIGLKCAAKKRWKCVAVVYAVSKLEKVCGQVSGINKADMLLGSTSSTRTLHAEP